MRYSIPPPGRQPPFQPTEEKRKTVRAMAAVGVPHSQIAMVIKCDAKTMRKYFREDLDVAAAQATAQVGGRLFKLAMDGDVAACIFWMKARAGWSEKVDVRHTMNEVTSIEDRLAALEAGPDEEDAPPTLDGEASEISEHSPEPLPPAPSAEPSHPAE